MARKTYVETFAEGPGGWLGWNEKGAQPLAFVEGAALSRGPWWIDSNHAPPGGGYLHLLYCLHLHEQFSSMPHHREAGGPNRFVEGGFPTDLTNAKMTLRLKGEVAAKGAQLVLLAQAGVGEIYVNAVLLGQPFAIGPQWSEQTITLAPDPQQWKCLGSHQDRLGFYGWGEIDTVLRDVNCDIILVLHPLDVVPTTPVDGDYHRLRAHDDYVPDRARLPSGHVLLDQVRIEFAHS